MNISVGIVGLPNVGKSTLFNALLKKQQALAANYPFATIEPNVGIVPVPDARLETLAKITAREIATSPATPRNDGSGDDGSKDDNLKLPPIKPALVEFVDIAGLVKGASEGEGLGNKFLSHIREVKVIAHVVRVFEDEDVVREGSVTPLDDYKTIEMELILADLQTISKIKEQKSKVQLKNQKELEERLFEALDSGKPARSLSFSEEEEKFVSQLGLLTAKPEIIVLNVSEDNYREDKFEEIIKGYSEKIASSQVPRNDTGMIVVSAKIESELAELGDADAKEYLKELGVEKSGLERLIQKAYQELGLISFLTCGEKEVRAWTIKRGETAVEAAGTIHNDFMAKFIKAEVVGFEDFVKSGGWKGSREKGKAGLHGKEYIMQDGDTVEFKIGR